MANIIKSLKIRCAEAGTNLTKVCRAAGVDRDIVTRWQKSEPRSFQTYRKLDQVLKALESKNDQTATGNTLLDNEKEGVA